MTVVGHQPEINQAEDRAGDVNLLSRGSEFCLTSRDCGISKFFVGLDARLTPVRLRGRCVIRDSLCVTGIALLRCSAVAFDLITF